MKVSMICCRLPTGCVESILAARSRTVLVAMIAEEFGLGRVECSSTDGPFRDGLEARPKSDRREPAARRGLRSANGE